MASDVHAYEEPGAGFATIERALADIAAGRMVVVPLTETE